MIRILALTLALAGVATAAVATELAHRSFRTWDFELPALEPGVWPISDGG